MKLDKYVREALAEVGAVLVRQKNHYVFRLPNGRTVVLSKTPHNNLHLRKRQVADIRQAARGGTT
jgi:predicted RNA binding protein YcfA (HicA-like mRNA interferase family)